MTDEDTRCGKRSLHAVVPVKELSRGKSRLASFINADERSNLALAMCNDVLTTLVDHPGISEVSVITEGTLAIKSELIDFIKYIFNII